MKLFRTGLAQVEAPVEGTVVQLADDGQPPTEIVLKCFTYLKEKLFLTYVSLHVLRLGQQTSTNYNLFVRGRSGSTDQSGHVTILILSDGLKFSA